jgi:hypothetical protein
MRVTCIGLFSFVDVVFDCSVLAFCEGTRTSASIRQNFRPWICSINPKIKGSAEDLMRLCRVFMNEDAIVNQFNSVTEVEFISEREVFFVIDRDSGDVVFVRSCERLLTPFGKKSFEP